MKRKIIQIIPPRIDVDPTKENSLIVAPWVALCNDGTIWEKQIDNDEWRKSEFFKDIYEKNNN